MSYAKLFGSILDSTVWLESKETRLVWITMLAMKDQDGIVEAAVPGLARRAGVSMKEAEAALRVLLAPDPHSRTPAHEGRRIRVVDGGWEVINHDRYRDREDVSERRAKGAARQARKRARDRALHVTRSNAVSREVTTSDTETDAYPDREARVPDQVVPVVPELPDPSGAESRIERVGWGVGGRGGARDAGMRVPAPPAVESPERGRAGVPADPRHEETKRLLRELVPLHAKVFNAMREELSAKVPAMAAVGDPAERALLELIRAQPSLVDFELRARHAIAVAEAEARSSGSVRYLGASVWREQSFAFAMQTAVGEGRGKKQRSAFDVLDEMEKEMDS